MKTATQQAKTTDETVAEYLAAQRISFTATLGGETKRDSWTCDEWRVTIARHDAPPAFAPNAAGKKTVELETRYYTGTGHRKSAKPMPAHVKTNPRSMAAEDWRRQYLRPVAPSAASVLHSLLLDAQGAEQPFDYWCSDFGYDTDSRKALDIYEACCTIRRDLYKVLTTEQRETLHTMLEDY